MRKFIFGALALITTSSYAFAARVCIDWNGIVLCGDQVLR